MRKRQAPTIRSERPASSAPGPQSPYGHLARPLFKLFSALLGGVAMCLAVASGASALSVGIMSGGNAWQDSSQWDVMQHSGATMYRMMIRPENSQAEIDNAFRLAAERNITILPYLYGFNGSSQYPYAVATGPGGNAWETWVYQAVERYGGHGYFWQENPGLPEKTVPGWEVWNEESMPKNSPGEVVSPTKYAAFLKRTSQAIVAAQKVMTPGVGTQVFYGGLPPYGQVSPSEFLSLSKAAEPTLGNYFNGLSLHPYSFRSGVTGTGGVQQQVNSARTTLSTVFGASKTLWITELGWNTSNNESEKTQNWVDAASQAQYLTESFNWIRNQSGSLNIPAVFWYDYRDHPGILKNWADYDGLRAADGSFKAAWYAFQAQTGTPAWPVVEWHTPDSIGKPSWGGVTSDPDISSWGEGRLDVFARGPNNELVHRAYANGWQGWENFGSTLASGPSAVSWAPFRIDVVARATDNSILHWAYNGSTWVGPDNLGKPSWGNLTSDPDISSRGYGILDIFARGPSNELVHKYYVNGGWSNWENLGGSLLGGPGAVSWDSHRMDVVGRATDNTVPHWAWNEVAWPFDNLGGNITSDPDISSRGYAKLDIFAKGGGNELVHKWYDGGWSWWESLGGTIVGGPGAVSWNSGRIDVVARATDNTITHWSYGLLLPP